MTSDDLEAAKLAALVSRELKKVDESTLGRTPGKTAANQLNPLSFVKTPAQASNILSQSAPQTFQPGQKVAVNVNDLLIQPDAETRKAMEKIEASEQVFVQPEIKSISKPIINNHQTQSPIIQPPQLIYQAIDKDDMLEIKKYITYTKNKIKNLEKLITIILQILNKKGNSNESNNSDQ